MKYIFILNKEAGKGMCEKLLPKIENACIKRNYDYVIEYITPELSGADIARKYMDEENVIYVVGGDGTITVTLQGIVGTKNKLGIIPAGSGNDTYKAVSVLEDGITRIDIAKINDAYFINIACSGLDAEVGNNIDVMKSMNLPSSQVYNASIIYTFASFKFKKVKLKTSIKTINDYYSALSVCNGSFYGGGFNIAPKSKLTDGLLDIYYIEKMPKLRMIPLLLKLKKGKHEGKRKIHKFRTNHVEINLEEDVTFNVDGEKMTSNHFVIDVVEKAIDIYKDDEFVNEIMQGE